MQSDKEFYENYMTGTYFLSSGYDGFMREFVSLPKDRVVSYNDIEDTVAAITEFVRVGMHAMDRFLNLAHSKRERIAVIGDGSLAFVVANIINYTLPEAEIIVIGRHWEKLELFSFAKECYITDNIPEDLTFDHGDVYKRQVEGLSFKHLRIKLSQIRAKGLDLLWVDGIERRCV